VELALHEKYLLYEKSFRAKAQRRKGAKRYRVSKVFLCAFAREKNFPHRDPQNAFGAASLLLARACW
jgi:hypothetical protein